ncbi:MAG: dephospho-CoA kinase [Ruminococcaceae bacterium]|nr:dephospho-CoA kinase [Oscillospiraceae bacterium]
MLVIGLTGPTGAGKGCVAELFASYGLPILDADAIYHELLCPPSACLDALTERFGNTILNAEGTLNRRALAGIVFSSESALADLNRIAHRYVMEEIRRRLDHLRKENTVAAVLDAPQLFEAGAANDCNVIVSVLADPALRLERIVRRDGIGRETAKERMDAQYSDAFFRAHSDYVIENNDSTEQLLPTVRKILTEMGVLKA